MEAGGGDPLEPLPPSADSLRKVEQEQPDKPPLAEMLESSLSDKTEAVKLLASAEEMVAIPAAKDSPPKNSRVSGVSFQVSQGSEWKPHALASNGFGGANSSAPCHFHWGEEMSGRPEAHRHSSERNTASDKASCDRGGQLWNLSNPPVRKHGSPSLFPLPSCWGELKTETPATGYVSRINESSHWNSGKSGAVSTDGTPNGEEASNAKLSLQDGRRQECARSTLTPTQSTEEDDPALLAMFRAVANSRLAVRSQQKDEPDFTPAQKLDILRDLYCAKPLVFLERFRTALREEHLFCFRHLSGSYEADFYCAEVRRASLGKTRHTRLRNKRYAALQQLIRGGEYFSDEQMRCRDPLLYEQYIGQYLSDEELQQLGSCKLEAAGSLSGVLLDSYQEQVIQRRLQIQQEQEEACEEEEEEEDDDDDGEAQAADLDMEEWVPDQEEKAILREEFTSRMYQRFLDGKDRDFDYSEVDENPDFDNLDIVSRDEEERYFDGEDPEDADAMEAE
ncbi:coiled-coil domain-containing protein 97 [Hemicordylus capensis]|uniref:coiled-coil domain-containing protein 97 n=1 Tax=Hemicordylus capensis TaxID=884348 RepID=UPI0023049DCE|nr:coiled-coil domain-containing protein 97 [Hemicordylus capensis]